MPFSDVNFPSTDWTLISRLRSREEHVARLALNELCAQYHYPLYCFIRRRGLDHHDAQDCLHDFLAKLLRNQALKDVHEDGGRLRGFLAKALSRFMASWHRDGAKERLEVSLEAGLDLDGADRRFLQEHLKDEDTPERVYLRKWAFELICTAQKKLRSSYRVSGREALYEALLPGLYNGGTLKGEDAKRAMAALGMSHGAVRVAMHRLRADHRQTLRNEVRHTVERDEDVDAEITHLLAAFSGS